MLTHVTAITPPQAGTLDIHLPANRDHLAPKIRAALDACLTAQDHHREVWRKSNRATTDEKTTASEQFTDAWHHLVDTAIGTAPTTTAHHRDEYGIAAARFQRHLDQAIEALDAAAVHANLRAVAAGYPAAIGIDRNSHDPAYRQALALADQLRQLKLRPIAD